MSEDYPNRRKEDRLTAKLIEMVQKQDERMDRHEEGEFERYDKVIAALNETSSLARENAKTLESLVQRLEEPLSVYETGKSGVLVIKTSGTVIKWLAGVAAACGVIWAIFSKKIGG